ncbi:MAG: FHA domain-containing protein, partial [Planctomycetes bacterium]|nr:FHA domain-containing protein [Planctomycetota bacterium]
KRHAIIERNDEGWFIVDAGSSNGTFVNDVRATEPLPLYDGDVVRLGHLIAVFEAPDVPPPPPPPVRDADREISEIPERFRRPAPTLERGRLDAPVRSLRELSTALWWIVGIGLALFVYLVLLDHRARLFGSSSSGSKEEIRARSDG